ncbi:MAG: hypothetical protein HC867_08195 [Bacteroidia bacterium]|nr:hypothetical protein [Bacteroidia bacterium]
MKNFSDCQFKLDQLNWLSVSQVKIYPNKKNNLTFMDFLAIGNALAQQKMPLLINLNIGVQNPNPKSAKMTKFDWKLQIAEKETLEGSVNTELEIGPNENKSLPAELEIEAYEILSKYSMDELQDLVNHAIDEKWEYRTKSKSSFAHILKLGKKKFRT